MRRQYSALYGVFGGKKLISAERVIHAGCGVYPRRHHKAHIVFCKIFLVYIHLGKQLLQARTWRLAENFHAEMSYGSVFSAKWHHVGECGESCHVEHPLFPA